MKINAYNVIGLPVVVIDDYYDDVAVEKIWREIQFYSSGDKFKNPKDTGSATTLMSDGTQIYNKQNKGLYVDEIYNDRLISDILTENRKLFKPEVVSKLLEISPLFRYVQNSNRDCTLLSYYEDADYYKSHVDDAAITAVSWFYKKPKKFSGGKLTLEGHLNIDCEYNRTVIFPSIINHEVDPIIIDDDFKNKNLGRYTITQLLSYKI